MASNMTLESACGEDSIFERVLWVSLADFMKNTNSNQFSLPGLRISLVPIFFLILFLGLAIFRYDDPSSGPNQIALMFAGLLALGLALVSHRPRRELWNKCLENLKVALMPISILCLIGVLIGAWVLGGIVPALVVWGLKLLSPTFFLFSACIICSLVSLFTGSSWSTAGTMGASLIIIAGAMKIHPGLAAGAIICGSYFGDKMSPLSETTNLASAMARTDLYTHIRHMFYTTLPSIALTLLIFLLIGLFSDAGQFQESRSQEVTHSINALFDTSLYVLITPLLILVMIALRIPAIPTLAIGALLGILQAFLFQGAFIDSFATSRGLGFYQAFGELSFQASVTGLQFKLKGVDDLLNRGGLFGMFNTVWLIIAAMIFGGIMEGAGFLGRIARSILSLASTVGRLIATTIATCFTVNMTASDQYLSIVLTGKMYRETYEQAELDGRNLSRALEDGGTLSSPLVPWNTCGAYMSSVLGVATLTYLPFCFFNIFTPFISILYGFTGWTIKVRKAGM